MKILKTVGIILLAFLGFLFVMSGIPKIITYIIGVPDLQLHIYKAWGTTVIIVVLAANCLRYIIIAYTHFFKKGLSVQNVMSSKPASLSKEMRYISANGSNLMTFGKGVFQLIIWGNIIVSIIFIIVMLPTLMEAYSNLF